MNRPDDHEAKMARADLFKLAQYSFKLFKMIHENQELEGWVQAKVTKAADYISSVYHYMQYEMKVSEYGDHLENAEMYSESIRRVFEQKLIEARRQAEAIKNSTELNEGWEDMMKAAKDAATNKGTGKFDKKEIKPGVTQYTRKSSTFDDGGDDKDTKKAKKAGKVKENNAVTPAQGQALMKSSDPNAYNKMKGIKTPAKTTTAVSDPEGVPAKPGATAAVKEAKKSKKGDGNLANNAKPYDKVTRGDVIAGRLGKDEKGGKAVKEASKKGDGNLANNAKPYDKVTRGDVIAGRLGKDEKGGKVKEAAVKCNHTPKGEKCPVHGLKECGGMYEAKSKNLKQQAAIAIAKKKA